MGVIGKILGIENEPVIPLQQIDGNAVARVILSNVFGGLDPEGPQTDSEIILNPEVLATALGYNEPFLFFGDEHLRNKALAKCDIALLALFENGLISTDDVGQYLVTDAQAIGIQVWLEKQAGVNHDR